MRTVVIGAGSIGANIAYALTKAGAEVTLVDGRSPAGGTSGASIAWLAQFPQLSWSEPPGRAALRGRIYPSFEELRDQVGGDWLHWSGTLTWGTPGERDRLRAAVEAVTAAGVDLEVMPGDEATARFPGLAFAGDDEVIWEPGSGWVDVPALVDRLVEQVRQRGGEVLVGSPVTELVRQHGTVRGVVLGNGRRIDADVVVNAAGSWGTHIAALADVPIPLDLVPGLVIYTAPTGPDHRLPILNSPQWSARPDPSGGLAVHWRGRTIVPDSGGAPDHGTNERTPGEALEDVARTVPALRGTMPRQVKVGIRPIPPGGPMVGFLEGRRDLYFALSHGGIGWGPTWGWAAVREILRDDPVAELADLRPGRYSRTMAGVGRFADDAEQID